MNKMNTFYYIKNMDSQNRTTSKYDDKKYTKKSFGSKETYDKYNYLVRIGKIENMSFEEWLETQN